VKRSSSEAHARPPAALAAGSVPFRSIPLRSAPLSSPASAQSSYLCLTRTSTETVSHKVLWEGVHRARAMTDLSSANHRYYSDLQRSQRAPGDRELMICLWMEDSFTGHVCSCTPAKRFAPFLTLPVLRAEPQHHNPPRCRLFRCLVERSPHPLDLNNNLEAVRTLPTSFLDWLGDARLQS
jgi:hypothetical protein